MADEEEQRAGQGFVASGRVYEQQGGRKVLVATEGDVLSQERAEELGLAGGKSKSKGAVTRSSPINEPLLTEGLEPIDSPEADARATGHTAEARARGGVEPAPSPSITMRGPVPQDKPKQQPPKGKAKAKGKVPRDARKREAKGDLDRDER